MKINNPTDSIEQVLTVTVKDKNFQESLDELISLIQNLEAEVVINISMHQDSITSSHYLGKGKVLEVQKILKEFSITTMVVNDNISPSQKKNLENELKVKVLDRTEVILAIFAIRAATKEAKLQVELAQLQYLMPRLTNMWGHLSRQQGGIGTKGVGEKQIEIDRRIVQKKISKLKKDLKKVIKTRSIQRKRRLESNLPLVSLVGYTNVGKSTIFNYFKGKDVYAQNQLFATLDTITKRIHYPDFSFYLIDTVGFISKLPHFLVESFKATLEEVKLSDILLHIIDVSNPNHFKQMQAVDYVLSEMEISDKKIIKVYNKVDKLPQKYAAIFLKDNLTISAVSGENIDILVKKIQVITLAQ